MNESNYTQGTGLGRKRLTHVQQQHLPVLTPDIGSHAGTGAQRRPLAPSFDHPACLIEPLPQDEEAWTEAQMQFCVREVLRWTLQPIGRGLNGQTQRSVMLRAAAALVALDPEAWPWAANQTEAARALGCSKEAMRRQHDAFARAFAFRSTTASGLPLKGPPPTPR